MISMVMQIIDLYKSTKIKLLILQQEVKNKKCKNVLIYSTFMYVYVCFMYFINFFTLYLNDIR